VESRQEAAGLTKASEDIMRLCCWRIAALLQKQLPFFARCGMSAHPKQPVV
jgi:hypothetical protein